MSPVLYSPDRKYPGKDGRPPVTNKPQYLKVHKPAQSHLQLSASASQQRRPSQISEGIESLITIGEYFGG